MPARLWPKLLCTPPARMSPCRSLLAHGVARANTPQRKATRRQFLNELMTALPVHPVTVPVALRAGQIDGEKTALGVRVALSDPLIGLRRWSLATGGEDTIRNFMHANRPL